MIALIRLALFFTSSIGTYWPLCILVDSINALALAYVVLDASVIPDTFNTYGTEVVKFFIWLAGWLDVINNCSFEWSYACTSLPNA